jgi:hypothetical protein
LDRDGVENEEDSGMATFEIHLESWNDALHIEDRGHNNIRELYFLEALLAKYRVKAHIFVLGKFRKSFPCVVEALRKDGHIIGSHGEYHYYDEKADRSPYFNQEGQPGLCGGFFFRLLPLWFIKSEIKRTGLFYIHPHDLDENHPKLSNRFMDWKRRVGLKKVKSKLEKLLQEVKFE